MRANRKVRAIGNDKAQVGIGTMIVFIATVLVAAIAASVLIDTSGKLQERSSRTGNEATEQVSSNVKVESIVGKRNATSDAGLKYIEVYLALAPGAATVDLNQMKIQMQNGSHVKTLDYKDSTDNAISNVSRFWAASVRDADSSFTTAKPVMTSGDLVKVTIDTAANTAEYGVRDRVLLVFLPEVGSKIQAGFNTPPSYGTQTVIELR
ncbi:MAG: archaellin/type IV pilin N-terminal domain-containing protein [Methanobacteriota archaeon]